MFLGEYEHSLDAKGRAILPARFRTHLESGCVLTKGREPCVVVYPREEFNRISDELKAVPMSSAQARNVARVFYSGASEQVPDSQGRVLVPETLRRYAGLDRDLLIAGLGNRFEIWDRSRWSGQLGVAEGEYSEIAEERRFEMPV